MHTSTFLPKLLNVSNLLPNDIFSFINITPYCPAAILGAVRHSFIPDCICSKSFYSVLFCRNVVVANRREMTVVSYHSTLISNIASQEEAADKTSSQIFLSRGVAGADVDQAPAPRTPSPTFVMSVFESRSSHVMTLGNATARTASAGTDNDPTQLAHVTSEKGKAHCQI
jgi:hypothetical protein